MKDYVLPKGAVVHVNGIPCELKAEACVASATDFRAVSHKAEKGNGMGFVSLRDLHVVLGQINQSLARMVELAEINETRTLAQIEGMRPVRPWQSRSGASPAPQEPPSATSPQDER